MGLYRARDLITVPGLLSLARIPLAASFPFALSRPLLALAILTLAGISDVADGWYARRFGQVTATGTALDPVTDKLFVGCVAVALVRQRLLLPLDVVLLGARELGELPLVVWLMASRHARRRRVAHPAANIPGKLATVLQFVAVSAAVLRSAEREAWVSLAAAAGALAAISYWRRDVRRFRAQ